MENTSSVSMHCINVNRTNCDNQNPDCGQLSECEPPLNCSSTNYSCRSTARKSFNYHSHNIPRHGHQSTAHTTSNFIHFNMIHLLTAVFILLCLLFTPGLADSQTSSLGESSILGNSTGHHHRSRVNNPNNHNHHVNGTGGGGHGHGRGHGAGGGGHGHGANGHHRCYVCLPPDRREAEDILAIFPKETQQQIPECSAFGGFQSVRQFAFRCPQNYAGCLLRIHGENITRSCAKFGLNDCKTANKVDLCYCTGNLCNYKKPEKIEEETQSHQPAEEEKESDSEEKAKARLFEEKEEAEARKFEEGDTDDEDLLQPHNDQTWEGSGGRELNCEDGHGVHCPDTTTPKPTLVPNIRPTPSTTPSPTAAAPSFSSSSLQFPLFSILLTLSYQLLWNWRDYNQ